ncbi:hypothetical protein BDQ12DRAFT_624061 [Crucibulum laeve]|uniref:FAD-binding FR-type domain-containing protein n=1 Tax=Crucibulum laeve TaxID=68775 RepID=A0A5C3MDQ4_9AGAR|nr:hypothetical protein BDQ12DRAFT_624061 [Crucibulum laeve]
MSVATDSNAALKGWHPGEVAVQAIMHLPARVSIAAVVNKLPEQHRLFHTTRLHFLPVTTLDAEGRPWASVLTSRHGDSNFITSPSDTSLEIEAHIWEGDPISQNLYGTKAKSDALISGIGIEVATRRRNKFAGFVANWSLDDRELSLKLSVTQALGLCPKYINVRKLIAHPHTVPQVFYDRRKLSPEERLPPDVIEFIQAADTVYLSTSYVASASDQGKFPSHVGTNHRGGRLGFVRIRPSDGRTVMLPNYSGNRLMNSLGNIHVTPLAGLVFPSFTSGSILYITGTATNLFGAPAQELMPQMNVLTTIRVTGYVFVKDALPLREDHTTVQRSPYSPPVRYLAEEKPPTTSYDDIEVVLVRAKIHNDTLFTLTFQTSRRIAIPPSQNVVLDLLSFLRTRSHQLLDWTEDESTQNDDCVRTWTVSIPPTADIPNLFSITMRVIEGGLITPILYRIVNEHAAHISGEDVDLTPLDISVRLRGIGGDLPVPEPLATCDGGQRLLWIAGGIGLTPFLSLTRYIAELSARTFGLWEVVLVLSTREPEVMLGLITEALSALSGISNPPDLSYAVHLFSPGPPNQVSLPSFVSFYHHLGRLDGSGNFFKSVQAKEKDVHICGPLPFVLTSMKGLKNAGVDGEHVKRERFTY